MIGFCLAAGAGTRLLPLTRVTPKPLLAPAGRPLVDLAVEALQTAGATRVVVNAHHGAELLIAHLAGRPGVEVVAEPTLLGTGGGLVNAAHLGLLGDGDDPVLVTAADHVVTPADLAALAGFLDRSGAPMAAGLLPAAASAFPLRLDGTRVARDPAGPWDSAAAYAVRAGLLCRLEPGPASLVGRVLGPLLDRDQLAGLPFQGPAADAGTLDRLLAVSAGLLGGRWPYELPPGRLTRGAGDDPVLVTAADHVVTPGDLAALAGFLDRSGAPMAAGLLPAATTAFPLRLDGTRVVRDPAGPWDSAGAYAVRAGLLCRLEPGPASLVGRVLGPLLDRGQLAGLPFQGPAADAGTLARLLAVSAGLLGGRWPYGLPPGRLGRGAGNGPVFVAEGAEADPAAVLAGPLVLDTGSVVGPGAVLTRSVVGPGASVGPGALVAGSFLGPGARVDPGAIVTAAQIPGPEVR